MICFWMTLCVSVLDNRLLEQKVDHLTRKTEEGMINREDSAQGIKRYLFDGVDIMMCC